MNGKGEFEARGYLGLAGDAVSRASQFCPSAEVEAMARRMLLGAVYFIGRRAGLTPHQIFQEIGAYLEELS